MSVTTPSFFSFERIPAMSIKDKIYPRIFSSLDPKSLASVAIACRLSHSYADRDASWRAVIEYHFPSRDLTDTENLKDIYMAAIAKLDIFNRRRNLSIQADQLSRLFPEALVTIIQTTPILEEKLGRIARYLDYATFSCRGKQLYAVEILTEPTAPVKHLNAVLELGANPDCVSYPREILKTALHRAAWNKNHAAVQALLLYKAKPDVKNILGDTYLEISARPRNTYPTPALPCKQKKHLLAALSSASSDGETSSETTSSQLCVIS